MKSENRLIQLKELLQNYETGLYLEGEVISVCFELLNCQLTRTQIWSVTPDWIKSQIITQVKNFSDEDEIISFGRKDIQTIKTEMLEIKNWLSIQGLLDKIQTNTLYTGSKLL
ncbi:hypothetical protein [Acinetobacter modestus]|uniref:hypothetical protein n=1 Tax=Acinetobacter modestus TaxID=1776740 RepID=UPI00301762C1